MGTFTKVAVAAVVAVKPKKAVAATTSQKLKANAAAPKNQKVTIKAAVALNKGTCQQGEACALSAKFATKPSFHDGGFLVEHCLGLSARRASARRVALISCGLPE